MTEPYYADDKVTLYLGDCLKVDEWLTAAVLITDPPYGIGGDLSMTGYSSEAMFGRQAWDADLIVRDDALGRWGSRPYCVFGSPRRLDGAPPHRQHPLVWDKGSMPATGDTSFPWRLTYELIYVAGEGWAGHRGEAVLRHPHHTRVASQIGHPTPKPIALMEGLIRKAPPGVIADPFAGSGSTLVAARNLGRKAIGVELEERYAEVAARRLAQDCLDFGETA